MNNITRQIFRAVYEGKWLYVEYCNKKSEQVSRFWIGIKDILKNKDGTLYTLQCSGLHLHTYTLADNMLLSVEGLFSAAYIARLKNTASLPTDKHRRLYVRYRVLIEQLPKLILCSVVQF